MSNMRFYHAPTGTVSEALPAEAADLATGASVAPLHPMRTEELARCGWYILIEEEVPAGRRLVGWSAPVLVNGCYERQPVTEPIPLAELQTRAIEGNRAECRRRILAVWPEVKQLSASLGVYPPAEAQACADWIAAHIAAENAAADLIDVAADAAAVAAVKVVWP